MTSATRTFFSQQAANRRNSVLLLLSVGVLFALLGFAGGYAYTASPAGAVGFMAFGLLIAVLMTSGSYFSGDKIVLAASKAKPVSAESYPQLLNVVNEITIAAGIPAPKVYVIDDSAPNAFATGRDPEHASIAVTTGLLDKLERDELQGVIAHELGHVRNLDIRFMLLIGVLVGGIALIADMFLRMSFFRGGRRGGRDGGGAGQLVFLVIAILFAILAPIAARLVQLSVSRQREYLADATAVELTRNPAGLEGALRKIATDREVLEVANRSTQHLYFVNPIKKFEERASSLWATHPPLPDRIDRLRELQALPPLTDEERHSLGAH